MSKAPKDLRIPIMMSSAEVDAIDEWRFANKIATRAEAVRRLCQMGIGLDTEAKDLAERSEKLTEQGKGAIISYINAVKSGSYQDRMSFAETLIDYFGSTAGLQGFVSRLIGASNISKTLDIGNEVLTYKEAVKKLLEQRYGESQDKA